MSADERIGIVAALDDVIAHCESDAASFVPAGATDRQVWVMKSELERIAKELRWRRAHIAKP